ncbi:MULTISPECIES: insecticidal delta-endotoxin Cry8Ea1 family protein [Bacillus cereus group]|uniref:Crystaline entomocidal protoxin n=3 Tax=Bacteria TaxID=2 RepID=A0ABD5I8F3_BACTU|nr:insecticidal delta-endotoxin Cry8Ea1 family protein [Bacillus thuringiensis]MCU5281474.1 insecticidal delta-endotoxin Cry8Ea1 family protein [Bacillus cereus]AMR88562.1 pesticidal protein [Bacillus thuringiensis]EEM92924.1 Pesticidal crystal protein cry1Ae [Bacillus thuringiensis IBL 200]MBG9640442.1 pesticidal protein [Bacillus thuringiensis]MBG9676384.1 pesticidal protein [Bacillus thuringiensis]
MEVNHQNECVPYNCLKNPKIEMLDIEGISSRSREQVAEISLGLTRFLLESLLPGASFGFGLFDIIWGVIGPDQWSLFLTQIEQLIDQRIEAHVRNQAISRLEGLGDSYEVYIESLREWEASPNNESLQQDVRNRFSNTDNALITAIPILREQGFEIPLLTVYVQAANLHLSLLRDAVYFGQRWGLDTATVNNHYNRLINLINTYSDHCAQWFNRGLDNFGVVTARYLDFQREVTISVLDIVALFPNYDIRTYPIQTLSQLTREIYTSPVAEPGASLNVDLRNILREPHLMDFLTRLVIYTGVQGGIYHWAGHEISSRTTGNLSSNIQFPLYGTSANADRPFNLAIHYSETIYRTLSAPIYSVSGGISPNRTRAVEGVRFLTARDNNLNSLPFLYRKEGSLDSFTELPPEDENEPPYIGYSHRLCHARFARSSVVLEPSNFARIPVFSWTHRSAGPTNEVSSSRITQIPWVKAHTLDSGAFVIKGPGFTGGDILTRPNLGTLGALRVTLTGQLPQTYNIRIRYASIANRGGTLIFSQPPSYGLTFPKTMDIDEPLTSRSFARTTLFTPITFTQAQAELNLTIQQGVYIDRIEFIPVNATFEAEYDLERAQEAVNALFTSSNQLGLKTDLTDYHIDQVSNLVDCLSDEFCIDEKRELSEKVKHAKRLSDERNLLQDSNFRGINRQPDRGWRGSTDITIQGGNDVFKENYVTLPGTFDECYPTYLYQKIDESKLKAYTRYQLRGYIEDSQDLEIYLIRYNAKHETVNVPGTGSLWPLSVESPIGKCGEPNRCVPQLEWNSNLDCSCRDGEKCAHHSHHFSLDIDVGCTDLNEDLGVWVIFKIKTQDGHARLGNLEFLEEKPLLGEALARVKRAEKKWRDKRETLQLETNIVYKEAKESVDALFANSQYNRLQADTNIAMIHAADKRVHRIREAYLPELSVIPGVNAGIFEELEGRIFTAFSLYDARNVIKNSDFNNGLSCWNVKGHVDIEEQNNHRSVLVVPEWEAEVSQKVHVCPGRGYILRVTAYKEGYGEGCVTIHEIEDHTDELKFRNCEEDEVYPNNTRTCNAYPADQEGYEGACTSRNRGYDEVYGNTPSLPADYAPIYEENAYTDGRRGNPCESSRGYGDYTPLPAGYETKELEYFPETDTVWIKIGETEGTFIVDSVELLLMEE